MDFSDVEIVVLKPSSVFLAFLSIHLSEQDLPDLKLLQTNNTAYLIPKYEVQEETLDFLEDNFSLMFSNEIKRWLGPNAHNPIENNFLDFLTCFKCEFHNHLVLMEPSLQHTKQVLTLRPRAFLLEWMKDFLQNDEELVATLEKVSLSQLAENSTMVLKNFDKVAEVKPFIAEHYPKLVQEALRRISYSPQEWPEIESPSAFSQYFAVEIHTQLIHLYQ